MGRIRTELGLDGALTLAQAVRAAQEALGLAPEGTLAAQVEALTRTLTPSLIRTRNLTRNLPLPLILTRTLSRWRRCCASAGSRCSRRGRLTRTLTHNPLP